MGINYIFGVIAIFGFKAVLGLKVVFGFKAVLALRQFSALQHYIALLSLNSFFKAVSSFFNLDSKSSFFTISLDFCLEFF